MRILVVDDNDVTLEIEKGLLEGAGHRVDTAHNNKEALSLYKNSAYDLILTDAEHLEDVGPDGEEGLKLARAIQKKNPSQRIGFVTSHLYQIAEYPTLHKSSFEREEFLTFVNRVSETDCAQR